MLNTFLITAAAAIDVDTLLTVTITGLLIVFSVLVLLTIIFRLFGAIADGIGNKPKKVKKAPEPELPGLMEEPDPGVYVPETPQNQLIAVIAAAIAAYEPGKKYAIRSVRRATGGKNPWSAAGAYENTRPF